ncbi:uncharacterized protein BYT42DRAFT_558425 [Radiomyces spectabilis]|uniref:uncharacterized protein n=1 Tax=Radiomyces spectabilis TaxID=64574 RepID=UPI00221EA6B0|nr:uncharacterized protein BYT42DRAFT_558425 [Radiomyces spectabilis]KAI8387964.1 hypothetical protein BYT42DRAFT_558425 [Radiomyces spectabilis]
MEANFDDPTDFRLVQLQTLDENLRCPICKELFKTTMILSTCSHSFCALCIRRSLSSEACCPKCRKPAHESNLHNNYDLDNTVNTWRSSRELLLALDQQHSHAKSTPLSSPAIVTSVSNTEITNAQANDTNVFQSTPHRRSSRLEKKKSSLSPSVTTPVITAPPIEYVPSPTASAPASAQPTAPIQPTASTHSIPAKLTEESLVTCPICQQRMKMAVLNVHLDRCMQGDSRIPPDPKPSRASPSSLTHPSASSAPSVYFSSMSSSHSSPVSTPFAHSRTINLGKKPTKLVYDMQKEKDMRRILKIRTWGYRIMEINIRWFGVTKNTSCYITPIVIPLIQWISVR